MRGPRAKGTQVCSNSRWHQCRQRVPPAATLGAPQKAGWLPVGRGVGSTLGPAAGVLQSACTGLAARHPSALHLVLIFEIAVREEWEGRSWNFNENHLECFVEGVVFSMRKQFLRSSEGEERRRESFHCV